MNNKMLTIFVSIIVAGVVVGASLPIFASFTTSKETHTNDGAGWIRFNYDTNASEYEISLTESEDGITITNGSDTQTYSFDSTEEFNTILYADTNLSVWVDDDNIHVLGLVDGSPVYFEGWGDFTISRTVDGVSFGDDDYNVTFDAPTWAYVPWSKGSYGFFTPSEEGVATYPADMPNAIVGGGFAGVYAYNDIYRYEGLGLVMTPTYNGDNLTGAGWAKPSVPFDPQQITITPLDPSVIGGGNTGEITDPITPIDIDPFEPDAGLTSVPTPQHTAGDWGYNIISVDGVNKAAIVSYSGSGGDIVVPATIGGYDVQRIGKNPADDTSSMNNEVFDNTAILQNSTVTISDGIKEIGSYAFYKFANMTDITISDSVVSIGRGAFYQSGLTSIVMPDSITFIGNSVLGQCTNLVTAKLSKSITTMTGTFYNDTNLESVILPPALTKIGGTTFYLCQKLSNIGIPGVIAIPDTVTEIGIQCFANNVLFTSVVIPASVTSIGSYLLLGCTGLTSVIIASDATPGDSFGNNGNFTNVTEILDLSDTVDYSVDRYNLPTSATVQDNIGDCFGFISVVSYTTGGDSTPTQTIIAMLPLVMVAGLVIMAVVMLIYKKI